MKITKGAKSISILEPVEYTRADGSPGISYNVKKVFDVTQTNGRKAPAVSDVYKRQTERHGAGWREQNFIPDNEVLRGCK